MGGTGSGEHYATSSVLESALGCARPGTSKDSFSGLFGCILSPATSIACYVHLVAGTKRSSNISFLDQKNYYLSGPSKTGSLSEQAAQDNENTAV